MKRSTIQQNGWLIAGYLIFAVISVLAVRDLQALPPDSNRWRLVGVGMIGILLLSNAALLAYILGRLTKPVEWLQSKLPVALRFLAAILLVGIPAVFLVYSPWSAYFSGYYLRLFFLLLISSLVSLLLFPDKDHTNTWVNLALALGIVAFTYSVATYFAAVRTTPFSLSWSEGNRFYDYSLTFAKDLYQYTGDLRVPYNTPGRYALWGALFLIPGLPIWVHRCWNALLWVGTPLLLAWLLFRPVINVRLRWSATLWGALFILQGPVYPHLLVPMILLTMVLRSRNFWLMLIVGALISYYAAISRFTWALLPGVWLVLFDLLVDYPTRPGVWWKRLLPPSALGIAGILPGVLGTWFSVLTPEQAFAAQQPLLLNRLWPNATYGEGILIGAVITTLPIVLILWWYFCTPKFRVHPLAGAAMLVVSTGFLGAGLLASTKIGGGSNLHNLDMFFLTILLLAALALERWQTNAHLPTGPIPRWVLSILILVAVIPGWMAYRVDGHVEVPAEQKANNTLQAIRSAVSEAKGEVLFLDQRQLITFGFIQDVKLIPDYEKKYMMDQAMGSNAAYFEQFTRDLKESRFALIVSDIQKTNKQDQSRAFSEENNAYVEWVSIPLLKYYQPIFTSKECGVMLLVPRQ